MCWRISLASPEEKPRKAVGAPVATPTTAASTITEGTSMGLTIHWELHASCRNPGEAKSLLETLRNMAAQLPFEFVSGHFEEFSGDACKDTNPEDELRWLKIVACRYIKHDDFFHDVHPLHFFAFVTHPGPGCETAVFGLAQYPDTITVAGRILKTRPRGWSWAGFCKTRYSSNPAEGCAENFLKCHLAVVSLLDAAEELGILKKVTDESDYWKHRDRQRLVQTVRQWNRMMAGFAGKLKDSG